MNSCECVLLYKTLNIFFKSDWDFCKCGLQDWSVELKQDGRNTMNNPKKVTDTTVCHIHSRVQSSLDDCWTNQQWASCGGGATAGDLAATASNQMAEQNSF